VLEVEGVGDEDRLFWACVGTKTVSSTGRVCGSPFAMGTTPGRRGGGRRLAAVAVVVGSAAEALGGSAVGAAAAAVG